MVTRCVCFGKKFTELIKIAEKHNINKLEDLQKHVRFGENCKRCHPYVKMMLKTGQTKFEPFPNEPEPGSID